MLINLHQRQADGIMQRFNCRPSKSPPCPRVVVGKRCLDYHGDEECICQHYSRLFDHPGVWITTTGKLLTGEPYGIDAEVLAQFMADLKKDGLDVVVDIDAFSPWNPGNTIMITVEGREARSRRHAARRSKA